MSKLKTENDVKELIEEYGYEDVVIFSNPSYASAFIGVSDEGRAVYSYEKMVEFLMTEDNMSDIEAIEFIDYNCVRALPYYKNSPIIMHSLEY